MTTPTGSIQDSGPPEEERQAELDAARLENIQDGITDQYVTGCDLDRAVDLAIAREDTDSLIDAYSEAGFRLVRLKGVDRLPRDKAWQDPTRTNVSPEKAVEWVRSGGGLGIQCGPLSGGVAVVDCDAEAAVAMAPRFLPGTLTVSKGEEGSSHYYYYSEGASHAQFKNLDGSVLLDFKASSNGGGHQVAAPPTRHPKKGLYQFAGGFDAGRITTVAATDLRHRAGMLAAATAIADALPPSREEGGGGRHDLLLQIVGFFLRNGETVEDVRTMLVAAWKHRGASADALRDVENTISDTAERLSRGEPVKGGRALEENVPGLPKLLAKHLDWRDRRMDEGSGGFDLTDTGNAERFARDHANKVRYVTEAGLWLRWDGTRWAWCASEHDIMHLADETVRGIFQEASECEDQGRREALAKHAVRAQSARAIRAMLELAEHRMMARMEDLDKDPALLNTPNGTVDLDTRAIRPHDPEDLITRCAGAGYDTDAYSEDFDKFLRSSVPSEGVRDFLQIYAGYSATGYATNRVAAFLHGIGANGKSRLMEAIAGALGEYATTIQIETLMAASNTRSAGGASPDLMALRGARMVLASEPESGHTLAQSKFKHLTGGEVISARPLYGKPVNFKPEFSLWVSMNHKPRIKNLDQATYDRIRVVPFEQRFEGADADPNLERKLSEAAPAILNWIVDGAVEYMRFGTIPSPCEVQAATREYQDENDPIATFLEEECVQGPEHSMLSSELHKAYDRWRLAHSEPEMKQKAFTQELERRGYVKTLSTARATQNRAVVKGVKVTNQEELGV